MAGWASRKNGGVFEALVGQVQLIRRLGGEAVVFAARDEWSQEDSRRLAPAKVHYAGPLGPEALAYAPVLLAAMEEAQLDCLHLHGIWQGSSLTAARWSGRHPGRTIISPHGMLDPWITGRGRLKKALFRFGIERANWRHAALFHALTQDEAGDIKREAPGSQCTVIPNPAPPAGPQRSQFPAPEMLYLGRIHTKKNIDGLIAAWLAARAQLPDDARLTIAGMGSESDVAHCGRLAERAGQTVTFHGPAFGTDKQALLTRARFLALPSYSEGLPMAVLDAWAAGTPTIMSAACHLPEGFASGAALECGTSPETLAQSMVRALRVEAHEWHRMSGAAQQLASGTFGRETVASRWQAVYGALMQGALHG